MLNGLQSKISSPLTSSSLSLQAPVFSVVFSAGILNNVLSVAIDSDSDFKESRPKKYIQSYTNPVPYRKRKKMKA
ncbi:hypothetical protein HK100_006457 [Physocladia obscura]|uniref:Uncharacterized protein n=1 Tax=Physocladia obscura TaxID=109957 RepID=A0AAD5XIN5_9FUNG|nr:hypothetical protein HK100_006457 [Physocladia obscura]